MNAGKEKLKLETNIAAVRFSQVVDDEITGVAVIIPGGEIVQLDRNAPVVGRLRQIEWKGSRYGVFPDDLRRRVE